MAIDLVQWFSLAAMLSPYFKSFEYSDLRQQIEKAKADWFVVSFAARLLGFTKSIHTAFIVNINKFFKI